MVRIFDDTPFTYTHKPVEPPPEIAGEIGIPGGFPAPQPPPSQPPPSQPPPSQPVTQQIVPGYSPPLDPLVAKPDISTIAGEIGITGGTPFEYEARVPGYSPPPPEYFVDPENAPYIGINTSPYTPQDPVGRFLWSAWENENAAGRLDTGPELPTWGEIIVDSSKDEFINNVVWNEIDNYIGPGYEYLVGGDFVPTVNYLVGWRLKEKIANELIENDQRMQELVARYGDLALVPDDEFFATKREILSPKITERTREITRSEYEQLTGQKADPNASYIVTQKEIVKSAISEVLDSMTPEELGEKYINFLRERASRSYDLMVSFGDDDFVKKLKESLMTPEQLAEIKYIRERIDLIELAPGERPVDAIAALNERIQQIYDSVKLTPTVLDSAALGVYMQKKAESDVTDLLNRMIENPVIYEQIKAINDERKTAYYDKKLREYLEKYNIDPNDMHNENNEFFVKGNVIYWNQRDALTGTSPFPISVATIPYDVITRGQYNAYESKFEKDLLELVQDKEALQAIQKNPMLFLAQHFKYLTPEDLGIWLSDKKHVTTMAELIGVRPNEFMINIEKENPYNVAEPYNAPLEKAGERVGDVLQAVGVPEGLANFAGSLAVIAPVMIAGTIGSGPAFAAASAYYLLGQTIPTIMHYGVSQESLVALADAGTTLAVLSPATNAVEDAIVRSIVKGVTDQTIKGQAIRYGAAIASRTGLNITEDVPATALVLAIAGVEPGSEQWDSIMRETVIFDTVLGVGMPIGGPVLKHGIPELGAYALTYSTMRYALGESEEDARNAAIGVTFSLAMARHGVLNKVADSAFSAIDHVGALLNINSSPLRIAADALKSAGAAALPGGLLNVTRETIATLRSTTDGARIIDDLTIGKADAQIVTADGKTAWTSKVSRAKQAILGALTESIYAGRETVATLADIKMVLAAVANSPFGPAITHGVQSIDDLPIIKILQQLYPNVGQGFEAIGYTREQFEIAAKIAAGDTHVEVTARPDFSVSGVIANGEVKLLYYDGQQQQLRSATLDFADTITGNGIIYRTVRDIEVSSPADLQYAAKKIITEVATTDGLSGVVFTGKILDKIGDGLDEIAKEANLRVDVMRKPRAYLIQFSNADGEHLTNVRNVLDAAGYNTEGIISTKAYLTYNTPREAIRKAGAEFLSVNVAAAAAALVNTYFNDDDSFWERMKQYAIIAGLGIVGTTGARFAGSMYRVDPNLRSIDTTGALTVDVTPDAFFRDKLTLREKFGNVFRQMFANAAKQDVPVATYAAKKLASIQKEAVYRGNQARERARAIINMYVTIEQDGSVIDKVSKKRIPLIEVQRDENGNHRIVVVKDRATLQDIAARYPWYLEYAKQDPSVLGALEAAVQLSGLIADTIKDLRNLGILSAQKGSDEATGDVAMERDVLRADIVRGDEPLANGVDGLYLPRGEVVQIGPDGRPVLYTPVGGRGGPTGAYKAGFEKHASEKAQIEIAETLSGKRYVPPEVAIGSFTEAAINRIAVHMFAEFLISVNAQYELFQDVSDIVGKDLEQQIYDLRDQVSSISESIGRARKAVRKLESQGVRYADRAERVADRLAELTETLSNKTLTVQERMEVAMQMFKVVKEEMREFKNRLAETATMRGVAEEVTKELNKKLNIALARVTNEEKKFIKKVGALGDIEQVRHIRRFSYEMAEAYYDWLMTYFEPMQEKWRDLLVNLERVSERGDTQTFHMLAVRITQNVKYLSEIMNPWKEQDGDILIDEDYVTHFNALMRDIALQLENIEKLKRFAEETYSTALPDNLREVYKRGMRSRAIVHGIKRSIYNPAGAKEQQRLRTQAKSWLAGQSDEELIKAVNSIVDKFDAAVRKLDELNNGVIHDVSVLHPSFDEQYKEIIENIYAVTEMFAVNAYEFHRVIEFEADPRTNVHELLGRLDLLMGELIPNLDKQVQSFIRDNINIYESGKIGDIPRRAISDTPSESIPEQRTRNAAKEFNAVARELEAYSASLELLKTQIANNRIARLTSEAIKVGKDIDFSRQGFPLETVAKSEPDYEDITVAEVAIKNANDVPARRKKPKNFSDILNASRFNNEKAAAEYMNLAIADLKIAASRIKNTKVRGEVLSELDALQAEIPQFAAMSQAIPVVVETVNALAYRPSLEFKTFFAKKVLGEEKFQKEIGGSEDAINKWFEKQKTLTKIRSYKNSLAYVEALAEFYPKNPYYRNVLKEMRELKDQPLDAKAKGQAALKIMEKYFAKLEKPRKSAGANSIAVRAFDARVKRIEAKIDQQGVIIRDINVARGRMPAKDPRIKYVNLSSNEIAYSNAVASAVEAALRKYGNDPLAHEITISKNDNGKIVASVKRVAKKDWQRAASKKAAKIKQQGMSKEDIEKLEVEMRNKVQKLIGTLGSESISVIEKQQLYSSTLDELRAAAIATDMRSKKIMRLLNYVENNEEHIMKLFEKLNDPEYLKRELAKVEANKLAEANQYGIPPMGSVVGIDEASKRFDNAILEMKVNLLGGFYRELEELASTFNMATEIKLDRDASRGQAQVLKSIVSQLGSDIMENVTDLKEVVDLISRTYPVKQLGVIEERIRVHNQRLKQFRSKSQKFLERAGIKEQQILQWEQQLEALNKQYNDILEEYNRRLRNALSSRAAQTVDLPLLRTKVFKPEVAAAINKYINARGFGMLDDIVMFVHSINNFFRSITSTGDASFYGVTGLLAGYKYPALAAKVFKDAIHHVADPTAYGEYLLKYDENAKKNHMPTSADWEKFGLHLSDIMAPGAEAFDPRYTSDSLLARTPEAIQNIPGIGHTVRASNILYTTSGNIMRLEIAKNLYMAMITPAMNNAQRIEAMRNIADEVNKMTGWTAKAFGDIGGGTGAISAMAFYAPRWMSSQFALLYDAATKPSMRGAIAREALMRMIGIGGMLTVMINEILGNETEYDPRSPNFMRIRIADYDISLFGPWDTFVRGVVMGAQAVPGVPGEGNPIYFFRSKLSPVAGTAVDLSEGSDTIGQPLDEWYWLRKVMPFSVSSVVRDIVDSTKRGESGVDIGTKALLNIVTSIFGIKASPLSSYERYMQLLRRDGVDPHNPLEVKQWKLEHKDELSAKDLQLVTDYTLAKDTYEEKVASLNEKFMNGEINLGEWVEEKHRIDNEFRGIIKSMDFGDTRVPRSKYELWISDYYKLFEDAEEDGTFNQRKFNKLLDEYVDKHGEEALTYAREYTLIGKDKITAERTKAIYALSRLEYNGETINFFDIPKVNPNVLTGYRSMLARGSNISILDYQDALQDIIDYVSNERAFGQAILNDRTAPTKYIVNQEESFDASLIKLWNNDKLDELLEEKDLPKTAGIFSDLKAFRKESNRNPLIDEIRKKYPYEVAWFDTNLSFAQLERIAKQHGVSLTGE